MNVENVTRFEVIDWRPLRNTTVRALVAYGVEIELSLQDDGKTLKVFLKEAN